MVINSFGAGRVSADDTLTKDRREELSEEDGALWYRREHEVLKLRLHLRARA